MSKHLFIDDLIKDLPTNINRKLSVIAGGAVANSLYNLAHPGSTAPINDIDIFVFNQRDAKDIGINQDGALGDYVGDIVNSTNNLKILDTVRDGLYNIIEVEVDHIMSLDVLARQLVENFDINATQACFPLDTLEIMTLPAFDEFIKTKQLKATSPNTPVKTMLRLLKKKKEFNCYFDDNQIKVLFQFARFKNHKIMAETYEKFIPQINELRDYFRVFKMSDGLYKIFLNRDKHNLKLHRTEKTLIKQPNNRILLQVFEEHYKNSKLYKKYLRVRPYRKTTKFMLEKFSSMEHYLKQDFNEASLINIEKVIRDTYVLTEHFRYYSLNETIELCKKLNNIEDKGLYRYVCGKFASSTLSAIVISEFEHIMKVMKEKYTNSLKPLTQALAHSISGAKELLTEFELNQEGLAMGHCVGGYGDKIKLGLCRIFSITTDSERSTIEIHQIDTQDKKAWVGLQHRSRFNNIPLRVNREKALELLHNLNGVILEQVDDQDYINDAADMDF